MCLAIGVLTLAFCAPCTAQPSVHWVAPRACPQADAFLSALHTRFDDPTRLHDVERIDATLTRVSASVFRLTLSVQRETHKATALRRVSARTCMELLPAAVWLVGLAATPAPMDEAELGQIAPKDMPLEFVDGAAPSAAAAPSSQREAQAETHKWVASRAAAPSSLGLQNERARAIAADNASRAAGRDDERGDERKRLKLPWHVRLAGLAGVFGGAGATAQGTLGAATSVSFGALHTQLSVSELLPAERAIAHAGHVQVWSLEVRVSECALWGKHVQAGPCAGLALLRTTAHTRDFGHDAHRVLLWGLAELGLRVSCPLSRALELSLAGAVGTPLTPRPSFTVDSLGPVATAARWSQAAQLGLIYVVR